MKRIVLAAAFLTPVAAARPDSSFSDGAFADSDWTASKIVDTSGGQAATFTASRVFVGGNPDEHRRITHDYCLGRMMVAHLRTGAVHDPSLSGAIQSIHVQVDLIQFDPENGAGVDYGLLLEQAGTYYAPILAWVIGQEAWTELTSDLLAEDFQRAAGPGPDNPDFSAAAPPIALGFYSGNSSAHGCKHRESGIDNWSVTVRTACPADFTGDGQLNVFDFLAFQTAFAEEQPRADLAAPFGVFNVFDFLAFQTAFAEGC